MRPIAAFMSIVFLAFPALAAGDGGGMVEAIGIVIQHLCVSALVAIAVFAALFFAADLDGDGLVNGQECVWGTNPSGQYCPQGDRRDNLQAGRFPVACAGGK